MGKKKIHLEGRTQAARIEQRRQLGSLRELAIQPSTKKRYDKALDKFFEFLRFEGISLPKQRTKMDDLLADYLEHLWSSGEGRALASDTVASLQHMEPHLKGCLISSWRLLKVWAQNEMPNRAPPFPEVVVHAMVGRALFLEDPDFALSILVGFYGMMRTGRFSASCRVKSRSLVMMVRPSCPLDSPSQASGRELKKASHSQYLMWSGGSENGKPDDQSCWPDLLVIGGANSLATFLN